MKKSQLLGTVCGCLLFLILSTSVNATTVLFNDGFGGYGPVVNTPPPGWTEFSDGGAGVDSSISTFWLGSGNTTGASPEGDGFYVRALSQTSAGEGLAISLNGFEVGKKYNISFYNAASVAFSGGDSYWEIYLDGVTIGTSAVASVSSLLWEANTLSFLATSTTHQIGFRGREGVNALLDSVVVSSIPLPPALWLFGSGLLGLIGITGKNGA